MSELYSNLGFTQHPFSKFSAEEETQYLTEVYVKPRYFDSLLSDLKVGSSRFILGERGSGKSALIFELHKDLIEGKYLSVIIDNYDSIPLENNDRHLLHLIIKSILKSYIAALFKNKGLLKNLNKTDKEKLAIIVRDFFTSISRRDFEEVYDRVTKYKTRNFFRSAINFFSKPINWAISVGLELSSDFVCKSLNLPKPPSDNFYKNYIPNLNLETIPPKEKEEALLTNYNLLKDILLELNDIVIKSGFKSTVVFLDKIDEFKLLDGKINKIVDFTQQVLKDTNLLYFQKISIVFSIWTEVKIELNARGVRFDKFKPIDINWTSKDIKSILEKRLNYFSEKRPFSITKLLESPQEVNSLIELSNNSPRDLIRLFSVVYDEQAMESPESHIICGNVIPIAKTKFCKTYDYYSIFPSKRGSKEDIISICNKILRIGRSRFRSTDLVNEFKFSQQSANGYIKIYKDFGLIKDSDEVSAGPKDYYVVDPKLIHLINSSVKSLN